MGDVPGVYMEKESFIGLSKFSLFQFKTFQLNKYKFAVGD